MFTGSPTHHAGAQGGGAGGVCTLGEVVGGEDIADGPAIGGDVPIEAPFGAEVVGKKHFAGARWDTVHGIVLQGTKESELALLICEVQGGR